MRGFFKSPLSGSDKGGKTKKGAGKGGQAKKDDGDGLSLGKLGGSLLPLASKFLKTNDDPNNNGTPYPSGPKGRHRYPTNSRTDNTASHKPYNNIDNDDGGPDYFNPDDDNSENTQNKTGQNLKAQYPSHGGRGLSGSGFSENNASGGTAPRGSASKRRRASSRNTPLFGKVKSTDSASRFHYGKSYGLSKVNSLNLKKSSGMRKKGLSTFDPRKYIPSEKLKRRAYERMTGRKIAALSSQKRVHWPCYILKTGDPKISLSIFRVQRIRIKDIINNRNQEKSCKNH